MTKYKTFAKSEISQLSDLLDIYAGSGQWIKCTYGGTPSYISIVSVSLRGVQYTLKELDDVAIDVLEFITSDVLPKEKDIRISAANIRYMRWEDFIRAFKFVYPFQIYSFDKLDASNTELSKFIGKDYWVRVKLFGRWLDDCYINMKSKYAGEIQYTYLDPDSVNRIFNGGPLDYNDNEDLADIIYGGTLKIALEAIELQHPVDLFTTDELVDAWQNCVGYEDVLADDSEDEAEE